MTINGWVQIALFCVLLGLLVKPLGGYMTKVFNGERTLLRPILRPIEVGLYKLIEPDLDRPQDWAEQRALAVEDLGHVAAERFDQQTEQHAEECDLHPTVDCHGVGSSEPLGADQCVSQVDEQAEGYGSAEDVI